VTALRRLLIIVTGSLVALALGAGPALAKEPGPTLTNTITSLSSDPNGTVVSSGVCTFTVTMRFSMSGAGFAEVTPRVNGVNPTFWVGPYESHAATYVEVMHPQLPRQVGRAQTARFDGKLVQQSHGKLPQDALVAELLDQGPAVTCPAG